MNPKSSESGLNPLHSNGESNYAGEQMSSQIKRIKRKKVQSSPKDTNQLMSNSLGKDFSNVKIHTDSEAIQMSQSLGAKAFTHGNDVYFNKGQYDPSSEKRQNILIAHELTHVVQQTGKIQKAEQEENNNCC